MMLKPARHHRDERRSWDERPYDPSAAAGPGWEERPYGPDAGRPLPARPRTVVAPKPVTDLDDLMAQALVAAKAFATLSALAAGPASMSVMGAALAANFAADMLLEDIEALASRRGPQAPARPGARLSVTPDGVLLRTFRTDPLSGRPELDRFGRPVLHSADGQPSMVMIGRDGTVRASWHNGGKLENLRDAPASITVKPNGVVVSEVWAVNGERIESERDYHLVLGVENKVRGQGFVANENTAMPFLHRDEGGLAAPEFRPV